MSMPNSRDVHVDAVMTSISIAYRNPSYIGEQVFPRVPVAKKSDLYFCFPKSYWFSNEVGVRAPGARAKIADYAVTTGSYNCTTYAVSKLVADEIRENADAPLRVDLDAVDFVTDALMRAQEKRIADLTTGGSGLWAYSETPSIQWSNDTSDPWGDIDAMVNGVVSSIGRFPNVMVMSWDVWRNLRQHPDMIGRIQYTRPGATLQPSDLTSWFNIEKVLIGTQLIDKAREGSSASMVYIWGDQVWAGYVPPSPALNTPAAGYTFEWLNRSVNRYRLDPEHSDLIEAQHAVDHRISASDAGAVLYNCV
jgi:hypothetical protein